VKLSVWISIYRGTTRMWWSSTLMEEMSAKTFGRSASNITASSDVHRRRTSLVPSLEYSAEVPLSGIVLFFLFYLFIFSFFPMCVLSFTFIFVVTEAFCFRLNRYTGRTQKEIIEYVRDNYVKRQSFQRFVGGSNQ